MNAKHVSLAALLSLSCGMDFEPLPRCGASHVTASLSSVTLASDCGGSAAKESADFAAGACAPGYECPSLCRQSSMQLAFASASSTPAKIAIKAVRLMDRNTRAVLQTLTSREPQQWSADQYRAWDESLPAGAVLKASYKLSAPTFYYGGDARLSYQPYLVEVDVEIEGELRTLSVEATREPEVAT